MTTTPASANDRGKGKTPKKRFWNRPWFWIWVLVVMFVLCGLGFEAFQGYNFPCGFSGGKLGTGYNICARTPTTTARIAAALRSAREGACCGIFCIVSATAAIHIFWATNVRPKINKQREEKNQSTSTNLANPAD